MATPDGFKVRTAQLILAIALLGGAFLNTGAAFPAAFWPAFKQSLTDLQRPALQREVRPRIPARSNRGLERIESMLLAERAVSVSA